MLRKDFFNINNDYSGLLKDIYNNIHLNGAVSLCELETISILKHCANNSFVKYETHFIYAMGLFYKTEEPQSFLDLIYDIYGKSIFKLYGFDFTPIQADIYRLINENLNFSFSAPTSTGKSFLFRTILENIVGDAIVVVPSRALLAEYLFRIKEYAPKETFNAANNFALHIVI